MSDSHRRDRGALVALGLALAAIVCVAWLGQPSDQQITAPHTQGAEYPKEHYGPAEGRWWPEFSARDTYAQWIMAGLALVATGASIWAVLLLRDTLAATRQGTSAAADAAQQAIEANRIMRDEQRPWIRITPRLPNGVRIVGDALQIDIVPVFANIGARPAYDVWIEAKAALPGEGVLGNVTAQFLQFWTDVNNRRVREPYPNGQIVFPNEPGGGMMFAQQIAGQDLNGANLADPETALLPHVFVCCVYRLVVNGPLHVTARSYMLSRADEGVTKIITVESCDVPESAVVANTSFQPSYVS